MPMKEQINKIKEQIQSLQKLRGVLDDDILKIKERELNSQLQKISEGVDETHLIYEDKNQKDKFITQDEILAARAERSVVFSGDAENLNVITGNGNKIISSPDILSFKTLFKAYLRSLISDCSRLPLGIVDPRFAQPNTDRKVLLSDVYTDLDVISPPNKEGETRRAWSLRLMRGDGHKRLSLLPTLTEPEVPRIVLLGDAGSGKTTFINYLTYRMARAFLQEEDNYLPPTLQGQIVVRLVLRNIAEELPLDALHGTAQIIWISLEKDLTNRIGEAASKKLLPYLQNCLWHDGGVFLLDGLDEVPEAGRRRMRLLEAIQDMTAGLSKKSCVLLTARPYAYAEPSWRLQDYQVLAIAPFNPEQVKRFVEHWHQAVKNAMHWGESTVQDRTELLLKALKERDYLSELATRPLLLTLMATLHTSWGELPEDRAELYEESIKLLLSRWERSREEKKGNGEHMTESSLERILKVGEDNLRTILEILAYQTHTRQGSKMERDNAPADISIGDVLTAFTPMLPDDFNPRILIEYLEVHSGLLLSRQEGVYSFPHRSFQEYLAACYLSNELEFPILLKDLVWKDFEWWQEVCLLAIGKARQGGMSNAVTVLNILLPENVNDINEFKENHWHLATLVGQALLELRIVNRCMAQPHYRAIHKRAIDWLTTLIEGGYLSPRKRLTAGDELGRLGDYRPGVGVIVGKNNDQTIPHITWINIPSGGFSMGSPENYEHAYGDEFPKHTVELPNYYVSRYPITNAQYRPFVESGGYDKSEFWTTEGWDWRNGIEPDFMSTEVLEYDTEERKRQYMKWISSRPIERRNRPYWWDDQPWNIPNRPVVGITWYEAIAFCKWLDKQLRIIKFPILDDRHIIRLPSVAEWEKAARGPDAFTWPWGNDWQEDSANTQEIGLKQTSTVGLFPKGSNVYTVLDMAGNVYEWVSTRLGKLNTNASIYTYPYNAKDGREDIMASDIRIVRGGAWFFDKWHARCSCQEWDYPNVFDQNTGFRVVISE